MKTSNAYKLSNVNNPAAQENKIEFDTSDTWKDIYAIYQNGLYVEEKAIAIEEHNFENKDTIICLIVMLKNQIKGLIPAPEVDKNINPEDKIKTISKLRKYIGQPVLFKIKGIDRENNICVLSRKEAIEKQQAITWKEIQEGDIRTAIVREVNPYQAKINIGGINTILPAKEMSYSWIRDVRELFKAGDSLEVKILKVDPENKTIKTSLKALLQDHWDFVPQKYIVEGEYLGKITGIAEYGVFINLEGNVDALLPLPKSEKVREKMKVGQEAFFKITNIDIQKRHIQGRIIRILF